MTILALDTSAGLCAAAVLHGERELGRYVAPMEKGHAEHLIGVIEQSLNAANKNYADLDTIAVAIGPGSFTGLRVGVATARGLALALKRPAIGVSNLEAVAAEAREKHPGRAVLAAFASARCAIQAALYDPLGQIVYAPAVIELAEAARLAAAHDAVLAGSAAAAIAAQASGLVVAGDDVTADIAVYARLAARLAPETEKPKPLYLREPDAKPQAGLPRVAS